MQETQETQMRVRSLGGEDLEEEMATHCSMNPRQGYFKGQMGVRMYNPVFAEAQHL